MLNQNFTDHDYNGFFISQKECGYVNLTHMAKAHGKQVYTWTKTQETKDLIKYVSRIELKGVTLAIYKVQGSGKGNVLREQGTWGHPLLAISFAMWLSTEFHIWSLKHLYKLYTNGSVELSPEDYAKIEAYRELELLGLAGQGIVISNEWVYTKEGKVYTDSYRLATKLGLKHTYLKKIIKSKQKLLPAKHIKEFPFLDLKGKEQLSYSLDYIGFSLVTAGLRRVGIDNLRLEFHEKFQELTSNVERYAVSHFFSSKKLKEKEAQSVYVLVNALTNMVKIGISCHTPTRVRALELSTGNELAIAWESPICSNAEVVEGEAHEYFKDYKVLGEYFTISKEKAISFLEKKEYRISSVCERAKEKVLLKEGV